MRIVLSMMLCILLTCCNRLQKPTDNHWAAVEIKRSDVGTPERMDGRIGAVRHVEHAADELLALIKQEKAVFRLAKPSKELLVTQDETDELGFRHVTMQRIHHGVPLWNESLRFHLHKEGDIYLYQGAYSPTLSKFKVQARLSSAQAQDKAKAALNKAVALPTETKLWILMTQAGPKTVWRTVVGATLLSPDQWECLVDANTGEILQQASLLRP